MIEEYEQKELIRLANEMRKTAVRVGPLHSWWDIIAELECCANNKKTVLGKTAQEYIKEAIILLNTHPQ